MDGGSTPPRGASMDRPFGAKSLVDRGWAGAEEASLKGEFIDGLDEFFITSKCQDRAERRLGVLGVVVGERE